MEGDNDSFQENTSSLSNSQIPNQKLEKKINIFVIILFVIIGGIVLGLAVFLFTNLSLDKISEDDFSEGVNLNLGENKKVAFMFDKTKQTITIDSINRASIDLIFPDNSIKVNIHVEEEKKFDLNGDGFYDLSIRLRDIKDGISKVYIKKINEEIKT